MKIRHLYDVHLLDDFFCGIPEMDEFVHNSFEYSVNSHFCNPYIVLDGDTIAAFFALSYDSVVFSEDYLDDFLNGYSSSGKPNIEYSYLETFKTKEHYPAIDIAYLAVRKEYQGQGLGSIIIEDIVKKILLQDFAGCQFVVVDALVTPNYSALPFYSRSGFTVCEDKKPYKDCVRMYRVLYPKNTSV